MSSAFAPYGALIAAIICETVGTSFLKESKEFTRLGPSLVVGASYLCAFYFLSISLRVIPVSIAYAAWSGLGIVLIAAVGKIVFKQQLDVAAYVGLGLIIAGVLVVNLFSKVGAH